MQVRSRIGSPCRPRRLLSLRLWLARKCFCALRRKTQRKMSTKACFPTRTTRGSMRKMMNPQGSRVDTTVIRMDVVDTSKTAAVVVKEREADIVEMIHLLVATAVLFIVAAMLGQ